MSNVKTNGEKKKCRRNVVVRGQNSLLPRSARDVAVDSQSVYRFRKILIYPCQPCRFVERLVRLAGGVTLTQLHYLEGRGVLCASSSTEIMKYNNYYRSVIVLKGLIDHGFADVNVTFHRCTKKKNAVAGTILQKTSKKTVRFLHAASGVFSFPDPGARSPRVRRVDCENRRSQYVIIYSDLFI